MAAITIKYKSDVSIYFAMLGELRRLEVQLRTVREAVEKQHKRIDEFVMEKTGSPANLPRV